MDERVYEDIKETLRENMEKIAKKIWRPTANRVKFWIHGELGSDKFSLSDYLTGNTQPNPANYNDGEWLISVKTWNDIAGMYQSEIEKAQEEDEMVDIVYTILLENNYAKRWSKQATIWGYPKRNGSITEELGIF